MRSFMDAVLVPALIALVLVFAMLIGGCASLGSNGPSPGAAKLPVQYGTIKLINNSDTITAKEVRAHVARVRALMDGDTNLTLDTLRADAQGAIAAMDLKPEDRLLIAALLAEVEYALRAAAGPVDGTLSEGQRVHLSTLLDWIEEGALYAGVDS